MNAAIMIMMIIIIIIIIFLEDKRTEKTLEQSSYSTNSSHGTGTD